jgi:hypothetical protein
MRLATENGMILAISFDELMKLDKVRRSDTNMDRRPDTNYSQKDSVM